MPLYSIHRQVLLAACFSHWLRQQESCCAAHQLRSSVAVFALSRSTGAACRGDAAALRHLLDFLRREGVIPAEKISAPPTDPGGALRASVRAVLARRARPGQSQPSSTTCRSFVGFSQIVSATGPSMLSRLSAGDVVRFVQRQAPHLHLKRAKLLTSALRSFLRYARYRGEVTLDLAAAVPIVANWSMPSIPRAIGADQVRQLLASIDRRTAIGPSRLRHRAPARTTGVAFR